MHEEQAPSPTNRTVGEARDSNSQQINGPDQSAIKAVQTFEYPPDTINAPHQSWGVKRIDLCKSESLHLMPLLDTPSRAPKSYHKTEEAAGNIPANKHIVALNNII